MSTIFFCSHKPEKYATEKWRHVFSQWYDAGVPFIGGKGITSIMKTINLEDYNKYIKGQSFDTREEWMMLWKALIFAHDENREINLQIADKIKGNKNPNTVRTLGRQIKGYDEEVWKKLRYGVVLEGNYLQFTQNEEMRKVLLSTNNREIVEAASYDSIWGVGYAEHNAEANRQTWGLSLLGTAIMQVREMIK